ncbi:MAG: gluconokinase [Thermoanaerobaculia bacterium]
MGGTAVIDAPRVDPGAEPFLLGIDLGSSSARAIVYDGRGATVAIEFERYSWTASTDGGLEIEADRLVEIAASAVDRATLFCRSARIPIAAVGISTFWHGLVGVDDDGVATTPVFSWGDTRASAAAAALRDQADPAAYHQRTGAYFHPGFPLAKLRWLRERRGEAYRQTRKWISAGDLLTMRLLDARVSSVSMSSASGLFHQERCDWDEESLALAGIGRGNLYPVAPDEQSWQLTGDWAARWPELKGVPWTLAYGDGACANIGSGCVGVERAALSIGTTAAMRVVVPNRSSKIPIELWSYRIDRERKVIGGATSNGGNIYSWCRDTLRLPSNPEEVEAEVGALEPDSHGLTFLPFLAGERSPFWPLDASAAISGITLATTPAAMLRAGLEAVAYRLALLRVALRAEIPDATTIVASGRAIAESPAFARIICDVLGEPLHVSSFPESSSRGAALLAGEAAAVLRGIDLPAPDWKILEPDLERTRIYAEALARQRDLERRLGLAP